MRKFASIEQVGKTIGIVVGAFVVARLCVEYLEFPAELTYAAVLFGILFFWFIDTEPPADKPQKGD